MALLFQSKDDRAEPWVAALRHYGPELDVRIWPDAGDLAEIDYALVWKPPRGLLKTFPSLKVIFSIGAGIDHLASDPELPRHLPVVRMVEPGLTAGMTEYVVFNVLAHHRRLLDVQALQRATDWDMLEVPIAPQRSVGILGLGVLGSEAARALVALGFKVAGWSRSPKSVDGVESFHGADGLKPFLARSEIVACLLPLTEETNGVLNADAFAAMPRGAGVINAGRGAHLVEDDLLAALESGQVGAAYLDVYSQEPLPPEHPFWSHPRVLMTPHIASITVPDSAAKTVVEGIRRFEAGKALDNVVDLDHGY
ncbi:MAG: glyoxylate/hydroxypyruvate reductase A [Pseudomonadota bacterium]